jgi:hypothetical protein
MSLINDALKRAKENRPPPPPPLPAAPVTPPLSPVSESEGTPRATRWLLPVIVVVLLAIAAGAILAFIGRSPANGKVENTDSPDVVARAITRDPPAPVAPAPTAAPAPVAAIPTPIVEPSSGPAAGVIPKSAAPDAKPEMADKGTLPKVGPATNVVGAPVVVVPNLRLQGVVFHPTRPSVMINGRTLFIGDKLDGYEVVRITARTAEMKGPDGPLKLALPD